jgi:hypothetical protein
MPYCVSMKEVFRPRVQCGVHEQLMLADGAAVCNFLLIYCLVRMFGGACSMNYFPYLSFSFYVIVLVFY